MIEGMERAGLNSRCIAKCDDCGLAEYEACSYERASGGAWRPNEGQVIHRLTKRGWSHIKGKLRCMACELQRKPQKEDEQVADKVTQLRQPTPEQKRQIFEMLGVAYDPKAGRYRDCETDVTVAEALGANIMFGWVAAIREEFFGPDGGNAEMENIRADLARWQSEATAMQRQVTDTAAQLATAITKVSDMQRRLDALVKATGPRMRA